MQWYTLASKQVSLNLDWIVRGFMDDNCVLHFSPVQLYEPVFQNTVWLSRYVCSVCSVCCRVASLTALRVHSFPLLGWYFLR